MSYRKLNTFQPGEKVTLCEGDSCETNEYSLADPEQTHAPERASAPAQSATPNLTCFRCFSGSIQRSSNGQYMRCAQCKLEIDLSQKPTVPAPHPPRGAPPVDPRHSVDPRLCPKCHTAGYKVIRMHDDGGSKDVKCQFCDAVWTVPHPANMGRR